MNPTTLVDRLRGIYNNDQGRPATYAVSPLQKEAAARIEELEAEVQKRKEMCKAADEAVCAAFDVVIAKNFNDGSS